VVKKKQECLRHFQIYYNFINHLKTIKIRYIFDYKKNVYLILFFMAIIILQFYLNCFIINLIFNYKAFLKLHNDILT